MPNLTTVGLTNGGGTSGTGTVSTLDNVIGTAGTPSAQVQTVQGIASMTPLRVDGSGVTQPVSGTVAISNFPATQPISGSVGVTGTVATVANLNVAGSAVSTSNPVPVTNVSALPAG